ncbi:hypothetical protein L227DRAFT_580415 [Lentinus tigrinus ALCF2SS1-6]|uniref:Uncharacterized protein n=1 Tax=Lentinus tigrinus ALCF2SS1-6 TaxID=1328759 RepID=A0A5C2RWA3_9APHY|nr:hypothetical protein L227DRAFT_580415 [Lentinus tigrinus ALCF2SS1-6]
MDASAFLERILGVTGLVQKINYHVRSDPRANIENTPTPTCPYQRNPAICGSNQRISGSQFWKRPCSDVLADASETLTCF